MTRATVLLAVLAGVLLLTSAVHAEDGAKAAPVERVAWFTSLQHARRVAAETGRPLFIALHVRPYIASPDAAMRMREWTRTYRDARLVELSRQYACVLRVISAPEGRDPDVDAAASSASHLVVDGDSRVLGRKDGDAEAIGGVGGLLRLLGRGLRAHGPLPADAPLIDRRRVARTERKIEGLSPLHPIGVPLNAPGVRLRLRWELPAPSFEGDGAKRILADVQMRWDGEGPFPLGAIAFESGEELDIPLDVRFGKIEGLAALATQGTHRVDLYLVPQSGSYPFSRGPLHVGRVWIDLGDGGGGGGGANEDSESEKPQEEQPAPPQPIPDGGEPKEPKPPPPDERVEVVEPFRGEGERVKKENAVVAVEDPDGGVKPPKRMPIEQALREFEKQRERAVNREGISPRDRAYYRSYFEFFMREARKRAPPRKEPPAGAGSKDAK